MTAETINSEVQLVFRKKTRGQVIGAELQEGFAHIGVAASEAGRLAAEQLGPRVEAAREAAGPHSTPPRRRSSPRSPPPWRRPHPPSTPPGRPSCRGSTRPATPSPPASRPPARPRHRAWRPPRAGRRLKAAADLAPRVEAAQKAAQKALKDDVVPRLEAAQVAALAYATPVPSPPARP